MILSITLPTKVRLVKAMVFPVVTYGCDGWEGDLEVLVCSVKSGMGGLRNEVDDIPGNKVLGTALSTQ